MSASFVLVTAFTSTPNGGNPAAVVFTDLTQPEDVFKIAAQNLNQPITAFVSSLPLPSTRSPKSVAFSVRWYTASRTETPLCGHGTLAAAKAIFDRSDVGSDIEVVELHTHARGIVTAKRREGGLIKIQLPASQPQDVSGEEFTRLSKILNETSGRELAIDYIATGGKGFENYIMFVLDEKEDLKNLPVNPTILHKAGFHTNVYTTLSSNTAERFVSRMFAPGIVPGDEDHVCGSAHCLMVPYWYKRLEIAETSQIKARQVSPRGGILNIALDKDIIKLEGEVVVLGKGELQLV